MANESTPQGFPAGLSRPALSALAAAGIARMEDLTRYRESEVADLHGMGPKGMRMLREAMDAAGLTFASDR